MIPFQDFAKVELKVATILEAEHMEGAEKLLKLQVDVGEGEPRQILAGLAKTHNPEDLKGRQIVVVSNLEPREMMGTESQGMLLAAMSNDGPVLIAPEVEVSPGARIS